MTKLKMAAIGLDHRHIYGQCEHMMAVGGELVGFWTSGNPNTLDGFTKRFPMTKRYEDRHHLLEDPEIDLVLIAAIPSERAALAIEAMENGKDVMVDKPGCTTLEQLNEIKKTVAETGRIWSVNFSERFQVPAVTKAEELVFGGAIGRVVQTVGLGPHKQNLKTRPDWFFDRERYGGILCDIASHQIDQFLWFTGSDDAEVMHAAAENTTRPDLPGFQDFGEVVLRSDQGRGYIRVDWFTPDGLPTWGDGRLFIQGTEGSIELRKYTDIGRPHVTDSLFLVNSGKNELIPCADVPLPYFDRLISDVQNRTETAAPQAHTFKVMELAITAQMKAEASAV